MKIIVVSVVLIALSSSCFAGFYLPEPMGQGMGQGEFFLSNFQTDESKTLKLNNGEKWKVVPKMMIPIRSMETDILSFSGTQQKEYKSLADKLKKGIAILTSSCTMKGEAHDELHKWLLPYIDTVERLSKSKNTTEGAKLIVELQSSIHLFNQYFQ
jgi:hypothetical protein